MFSFGVTEQFKKFCLNIWYFLTLSIKQQRFTQVDTYIIRNFYLHNSNWGEAELFVSGKASRCFAKNLSKLISELSNVKIVPIYKTFKVGNYFQLKSRTPLPLLSNVVYCFTCPCDTDLTYIGMSARHLVVRAKEHVSLENKSRKSAVKDHISCCVVCANADHLLNSFTVVRKCASEYDTKIHEVLLIKRQKPKLNRQFFGNGSSFFLKIF